MSYDKKMEELLVAARQSPTELSYDEVEFLFLNPTPPPKPSWWRRGDYLKFFVMFTLLIALLGFLLPAPAEFTPSSLSAFPVQEETPVYSLVDSLPRTSALSVFEIPKIEVIMPQVQVSAPKAFLAPAAAPEKAVPLQDEPLLFLDEHGNLHNVTPPETSTQMQEALFSGDYSQAKGQLMLTFKDAEEGPVNVLLPKLSAAELKLFNANETGPLLIERAAGSLLLYGGKKEGTFEFLPNTDYQAKLIEKGWSPTEIVSPDGFFQVTTREDKSMSPATRIEDQLWFRYFTTDINPDYLDLLREYGYTDKDFEELSSLANSAVTYEKLKTTLPLAKATISDQAPIAELWELSYAAGKLEKLRRAGKQITYAEFDAIKRISDIWEPIGQLQNISADSLKNLRKRARNQRFSLAIPGTVSDTITYTTGQVVRLKGNFEFKISKDPSQDYLVVYGPEKQVDRMRRRSDYEQLELQHKQKGEALYVMLPLGVNLFHEPSKGVEIQLKNKPKQ